MPLFDWMDDEDFNPNYLKRAVSILPRRGAKREWRHTQDHWNEIKEFPAIDLEGEEFVYRRDKRVKSALYKSAKRL